MSSQTKVQGYLNRHKIGSLFEGMMGKLVKDMPADPLDYLLRIIQEKKEKKKPSLTGLDQHDERFNPTSIWTSPDGRGYEKPWRAHSKKAPGNPSSPEAPSRREWDKTVKLTSKSFDELTLSKAVSKSGGTGKSISFATRAGEADSNDSSYYMSEEQLLSDELLSVSAKGGRKVNDQKTDTVAKHHPKLKGPKADSSRHNQELKAFLQEKRAKMADSDSGVGSNLSDDEEMVGAQVLAENADDLAAEGIRTSNNTSSNQVMRKPASSGDSLIHMSICSQCAKVVIENKRETDGGSSVSSSSTSASTNYSKKAAKQKKPSAKSTARSDPWTNVDQWATHRPDSRTSPQRGPADHPPNKDVKLRPADPLPPTHRTGFSSYYDDDEDEFESVSQVSGDKPRVPLWSDSDDEELAPVKGSHMLTSPRPGKPGATGSLRKSVTLREDTLRSLPRSDDRVEKFLGGNRTWSSGERTTADRLRSSHDSFSAKLKPQDRGGVTRKSYDALTSKNVALTSNNAAGWRFEPAHSDDESTLM